MKRRTCLFAHYDQRGLIAPHVMHYLAQLRECGFTIHVALSGMKRLHGIDAAALQQLGAIAHCRENHGLDFGAWQHLMALGCADGADTVLLANDSVFGPLQPLAPIFETMQSSGVDVWSMVESREARWHLQSWFLCFSAHAFAAPQVQRVLRLPFHEMSKSEIVLHGELGLGAAVAAAGMSWAARCRQPERRLRRLVPGNPMHLDFLSVMRNACVPFIKIELLRDNPAAIPWIGRWRAAVAASPIFPIDWIDRHLAPPGRGGVPQPRTSLRMRLLYAAISRDQPEAALALLRAGRPAKA